MWVGGLLPLCLWSPCSPKDSSKGNPGHRRGGQPDGEGQLQATDFVGVQMKEANWADTALTLPASGSSEGSQGNGNARLSYLSPCV